jgi:hypothetical protein
MDKFFCAHLMYKVKHNVPTGQDFPLHVIQSGSEAHPIQWVSRALFPGVKRQGREADHSLPTSVAIKNTWIYTSTPPTRLHDVVLNKLSTGKTLSFFILSYSSVYHLWNTFFKRTNESKNLQHCYHSYYRVLPIELYSWNSAVHANLHNYIVKTTLKYSPFIKWCVISQTSGSI